MLLARLVTNSQFWEETSAITGRYPQLIQIRLIAPSIKSVDFPVLQGGPAQMLRQTLTILSIVTVVTTLASNCQAQESDWDKFWERWDIDVQRNKAWPQPFLRCDQVRARAPFSLMVTEGWREQNTLTAAHFDFETQQLNKSGVYKVQSILRNAPVAHRSIFVHATFDPKVNQDRLSHVQKTLHRWMPEEEAPAIVMTTNRPYGVPGNYADSINRRYQESLPTPTLPVMVGQGTGAGGSGN